MSIEKYAKFISEQSKAEKTTWFRTGINEGMDRVVDNGQTPIGSATQHAAKLISSHTKRKHYFDGGDLVDHETDKTVVHNAASKPIHVVKKLAKDYHENNKD